MVESMNPCRLKNIMLIRVWIKLMNQHLQQLEQVHDQEKASTTTKRNYRDKSQLNKLLLSVNLERKHKTT